MTLEYNDTVPAHFNTSVRNQTVYFNGSDNSARWQENLKDPANRKFFEENGWLDEQAIPYVFNTHGFRCEEFDQRPAWLALGCSFTEGVGLPIDDVWPTILSKQLNQHVWNLGVGSSGLDTCFRLLDYYIDKLNVQGVFLLTPPEHRVEIFTNGNPVIYLPSEEYDTKYPLFKHWVSDEINVIINMRKNLLAIQKLCDDANVRLITRSYKDLGSPNLYENPKMQIKARDLLHFGKFNQAHIADLFYEDYKNGNS